MAEMPKIAGHAILAGAFFFVLQRFVNGADLQTSLLWASVAAVAAAGLAYSQRGRGR